MKQTTEVSGNQTSEACSSLSGVSMRQTCASSISARYQVYKRPHRTTRDFLTVLRHFWHSVSTRKIYRRLLGYSKFGRYSLRSGIFFHYGTKQGDFWDRRSWYWVITRWNIGQNKVTLGDRRSWLMVITRQILGLNKVIFWDRRSQFWVSSRWIMEHNNLFFWDRRSWYLGHNKMNYGT